MPPPGEPSTGGGNMMASDTYTHDAGHYPASNVNVPEGGLPNDNYKLQGSGPVQNLAQTEESQLKENGQANPETTRSRPRQNGKALAKSPSGQMRICKACGEPLEGQFVRALGGTFHLACFKCRDCGQIVASKFFPVDDESGTGQYPLCETDYFRRLDLLCYACGGALRGSYITALDRKYHIEHFTCSVCPTVFGAQDSYYEHEDKVYCHYHYSTQFAQRCNGCRTAILKQFVEIFRNGENQHWHPECYMIHKFWNVRLSPSNAEYSKPDFDEEATEERRDAVREEEERMEEKVYRIWSVLSQFEESSAACISDMLLHVSNGAYVEGVLVAKKFILHVDILFAAIDHLANFIAQQGMKELAYGREAKLLCKKIVAFFSLLSKTQETGVRKLGVTQELLSLLTGLAHYLKLLIRIGLQGALKVEREKLSGEALQYFLDELSTFNSIKEKELTGLDLTEGTNGLAEQSSDCCDSCNKPIDDECVIIASKRWHIRPPHLTCVACNRDLTNDLADARWDAKSGKVFCLNDARRLPDAQTGFTYVSKLQQYVFLLQVALARLLAVLRSGGTLPHTSDDPNLNTYEANEGHRISPTGELTTPHSRMGSRSRSYAGESRELPTESSLEQTVSEMKRLKSTRNERTLSTSFRKPRSSRILDGPTGVRPGSPEAEGLEKRKSGFQIIEERDPDGKPRPELAFGNPDSLTLDDIPRIVAAEQAKEQRPNAYRHARNNLLGSGGGVAAPKLMNGHQRGGSLGANEALNGEHLTQRNKRYFSELSALEYFVVRHIAVLSMEPLLKDEFEMDELLALIDTRKPTFWSKFGKAFKADSKKKAGVFGIPLETLIEKDGAESSQGVGPGQLRIPAIIEEAVHAMRQMDMSIEGVFRKNGNIKRLKDTAEAIDHGQTPDLSRENPVQVAALLKRFLRELPDPLLTFKLQPLFLASQKLPDEGTRQRVLHLTCCLLPKAHRDSMEVLFRFLAWVASFSHVDEETGSKMDAHNLATVMAPNLLYSSAKVAPVDDSFLAIEAIRRLIEYNDTMCEVPEDIQSMLTDSSLFGGEAQLTTKQILKRWDEVQKGNVSTVQRHVQAADSPAQGPPSGPQRTKPVVTRVDTDPYQADAWQKQSSVRQVGTGQHDGPGTPHHSFEYAAPTSPYARDRAGSGGSRGSFDVPNGRQSYQPKPRAMVSGAD